MKRIALIALIALGMIGMFVVNQSQLLAAGPPAPQSASATEAMQTANHLYESGQYALAAQAYEQLLDQRFAAGALFYNLGNTYYKQGDYGRAILNYRRAQQLDPRDADIEANLALARAQAVDRFEVVEEPAGLLNQAGGALQGWFTLNDLALAALATWILFVFLLLLFGSARKDSAWRQGLKYALTAAAILLVVGIVATGSYLHADSRLDGGVVVASEVAVTSGPGAQYVTEFSLHAGAEVQLVEVRPNWVRLALPGADLEGWVPAHAIEPVTG